MSTRKESAAAARVLRDVSDYLEDHAEHLAKTHRHFLSGRIEPETILQEVATVRRWSRKLRHLALLEVAP